MIKDLSAKLVAAAAEINQKSRAKFVEEQNVLHEKMAGKQMKMPTQPAPKAEPAASSTTQKMTTKNVKEEIVTEAEGSIPKTPREKELAAMHGHKKRITFGDVMKARGVGMKKEELEQTQEALKGNQHRIDKNKNGKVDKNDFELLRKEEVVDEGMLNQLRDRGNVATGQKQQDRKNFDTNTGAALKPNSTISGIRAKMQNKVQEEAEVLDELSKSTLGSYVKKAAADSTISRKIGADFEHQASKARSTTMKAASTSLADKFKSDARNRKSNVDKAVDRLTKEETEQTQEGWDDMMKSVNANKGTGKFDKKEIKPGVTQYTRKSSTFDDGTGKDSDERRQDRERRKAVKEENTDTPGNSTHQCAIHVKSEQFGEGRTLTSQHAEPDTQGNIAWYDVMFAEGIHRVETKDIEVLVSEDHMMHKKKKKAM